jgi:hypothetical protein
MKTQLLPPKTWVADRLTCSGHQGAYYWHIQDKEGDDGQLIALVPSAYSANSPDDTQQRAEMIAAMPEMLHLLERLVEHVVDLKKMYGDQSPVTAGIVDIVCDARSLLNNLAATA